MEGTPSFPQVFPRHHQRDAGFPQPLFDFLGWQECKVKPLRIQRRLFREESKELTREEYQRLLAAARALGRERLELLMETICATGIRVSEVKYITVEALACGKVEKHAI